MSTTPRSRNAQAWIEMKTEDPAAVSALAVARSRLAAGRTLRGLRRFRIIELQGALPRKEALAAHLHASTWFYNPHKEACHLRTRERDPAPAGGAGETVLVVERGAPRSGAAERWWRHETGRRIFVREGVAWVLDFGGAADAPACATSLMTLRDGANGLLANPHAQAARHRTGPVPLAWIAETEKEAT